MAAETSELRSGITSAFNKRLNEALQFNPQMAFNIENTVTPSQTIAVLKGEQGTPGLPAAVSAVKDDNNLIMLATSQIERGTLKLTQITTALTGIGSANTDILVPEGKKYKLKIFGTADSSFSGTQTAIRYQLVSPTGTTATITELTTSANILYVLPIDLLVPAGWSIRLRMTVSAYTSGQKSGQITYQELDV